MVRDNQVIYFKMSIHVPRGVGATKLGISWRRYSVFPCTLIRLFLQRNLCSACLITIQVLRRQNASNSIFAVISALILD